MTDDLSPDFMDGYECGWRDRASKALDDEYAAWWDVRAEGGRVARALAAVAPYADRQDLTGDHARAARQRALLAERGITTAVSA